MKKYLILMLVWISLFWALPVQALDYSITSYQGDLVLQEDNRAVFVETVTYAFDEDYNGQYLTLGEAGTMPSGFAIDDASIRISVNGQERTAGAGTTLSRVTDGYQYKIYNGGYAGDVVEIEVTWYLSNLLYVYEDIAELNWVPITNWDEPLEKIELTVSGFSGQGAELYAHTGYFRKQPQVEQAGDGSFTISLANLPAGRPLELHGAWPVEVLTDQARLETIPHHHLQAFQRTEANIKKNTELAETIFFWLIPGGLLSLYLASLLAFRAMTKRFQGWLSGKDLKARLYEPPGRYSPLVLAQQVFGLDVLEANQRHLTKNIFSFENLIQATILDLIDRGNIKIENMSDKETKLFRLVNRDQLSEAESVLMDMAFDGKDGKVADKIFQQYHISSSLLKTTDRKKEAQIQSLGREVGYLFDNDLRRLKRAVDQEIEDKHYQPSYRPMESGDWSFWLATLVLAIAPILICLFTMAYLATAFSSWLWIYPILLVLGFGVLYWINRHHYIRDGILTSEGAQEYYNWHSFKNMIQDIGNMNKVDLEGLVLWNRILVYATLFGEAERVSQAIKVHQIRLPESQVNDFYYNPYAYNSFYRSTRNFSETSQVAAQAQYFNVPSSNSSGSGGGFSSGGFSGGGGGGGGGAF